MGRVTIKEVFPVTITYKISETNSSFERAHPGESLVTIFRVFFTITIKIFILAGGLSTGLSLFEV